MPISVIRVNVNAAIAINAGLVVKILSSSVDFAI